MVTTIPWSTLPAMPTARQQLAAAADSSGRIYAIGGTNAGGTTTATVERFDPATGAWTAVAALGVARTQLAAAVDGQGRIYAIGGTTLADAPGSATNTAERYDPATNTWTTLASLSTYRYVLAAAADSSGRIYAIGGLDYNGNTLATVERFDPATGAWTAVAATSTAHYDAAAASDSSGRIYAIGGGLALATVEQFDPSVGSWSGVTPMPTGRRFLAAATDSQGRIYAIGGLDSNGATLATVERASVNRAPNAPALTSPANNATIDLNSPQQFALNPSDPDPGDSTSQTYWRYRIRDIGAAWTTVAQTSPNTFITFAAGTFTAGNYEWQAATRDAQGAPVGDANLVYSASSFFTAAVAPGAPTFGAPVNGATISTSSYTATISAPDVIASRWRTVADNAGAPDTSTVYSPAVTITTGDLRSHQFQFPVNNRTEHLQSQIENAAGLWSTWADSRNPISYTPPTTATFTMSADPTTATRTLTITNPAPGSGVPATAYNDVYVRTAAASTVPDTYRPYSTTGTRIGTALATNTPFVDRNPASGPPVIYDYRVVSVATNGTTSDSGWQTTA